MSRDVTSRHVMSCHVMSFHVTSRHVTACHVTRFVKEVGLCVHAAMLQWSKLPSKNYNPPNLISWGFFKGLLAEEARLSHPCWVMLPVCGPRQLY